jgi:hypothetical protein
LLVVVLDPEADLKPPDLVEQVVVVAQLAPSQMLVKLILVVVVLETAPPSVDPV